ncbi:MAG: hypothetical protein ACFFDJ_07540 [Candidatus Odinarchaeota archaeon]
MTNPSDPEHSEEERDKRKEESELREKLEDISYRLARIERVLARIEPEMGEFKQSTRVIREGMDFYGSLFEMMGRFTGRQRLQRRFPEIGKDEISRLIVEALEAGNPLNISQLTVAVRRHRGTASRRIIRERIQRLIEIGVIQESHKDKKATYYKIADDLL